jgi:hypothetical protein
MVGGQLRFGLHALDLRERSHLDLFLVVLIYLLRNGDSWVLHIHVEIRGYQIPVERNHVSHRVDQLLFEDQIGGLDIVLGDANGAIVQRQSEALQQRLGNCEIQV